MLLSLPLSLSLSLSLSLCSSGVPSGFVPLVTFDNNPKTSFKWRLVNDPVMGGVSKSTFSMNSSSQSIAWNGEVKIVPKLAAPGFCNLEMADSFARMDSMAGTSHIAMKVRTTTPGFAGFKVSFAAKTLNPQFKSYKSNFNVTDSNWELVVLPWDSFSNDWSPFTGDCETKDPTGKTHRCCSAKNPEVCPTQKDLGSIQSIGFWSEGASGNFNLEVQWIAGMKSSAGVSSRSNTCRKGLQKDLLFNVSGRLADDYIPIQAPPTETLAEAICCDSDFAVFAEPQQFFARPDVNLFRLIKTSGTTTFYDSSCGLPIFTAPINRTFAEFQQESIDHGWPSFRDGEVHTENIKVVDGEVQSVCGTHLGSMLPDEKGDRYCIDLACISGKKAVP